MLDRLKSSLFRALVAFCGTMGIVATYIVALHAVLSATCGSQAAKGAVEFVNFDHVNTNSITLGFIGAFCIAPVIFILSFVGLKRVLPVGYLRTLILAAPIVLLLNFIAIMAGLRLLGTPDPEWDSDPKMMIASGIALLNVSTAWLIPILVYIATEFPRWQPPSSDTSTTSCTKL